MFICVYYIGVFLAGGPASTVMQSNLQCVSNKSWLFPFSVWGGCNAFVLDVVFHGPKEVGREHGLEVSDHGMVKCRGQQDDMGTVSKGHLELRHQKIHQTNW